MDNETGRELRELWKKVYIGDMRFGVREARFKAEAEGFPSKGITPKYDRVSWIAAFLHRSCKNSIKNGNN